MMSKTYVAWMHTRQWCISNPRKKAAVVTREGTFEIVFIPRDKPVVVFDELANVPHDWIRERFTREKNDV